MTNREAITTLNAIKFMLDNDQYSDDVESALDMAIAALEQVRKEACQKGYETGYEDGYNEPGKNQQEAYQRGLADAWEAARNIADMPYGDGEKIFGVGGWHIFMKCTASEVIEKIKAWDEKKIKVGDEVTLKCGVRPAIYMQGTKGSDEIYLLFNDGSCGLHSKSEIERKTGRHFPEIATILEKMRGEQDGKEKA